MNIKPRRKTILISVPLAIAVVAFVAWYSAATISSQNKNTDTPAVTIEKNPDGFANSLERYASEKDSDGDGLRDWEETLWKTDPNNPDTDGDGTNDNDEIAEGRDPTVAGPDDTLQAIVNLADTTSTEQNTTETFAKNVFRTYIETANLDQDTRTALLSRTFQTIESYEPDIELYKKEDLPVSLDSSIDAARQYANTVAKTILDYSPLEEESELFTFQQALQLDDPGKLKEMDDNIQSYTETIKKLAVIPAPETYLPLQLALINSIVNLRASIVAMRNVFIDPIPALLEVNKFQEKIDTSAESLRNIKTRLDAQNIVFSDNEFWQKLMTFRPTTLNE